MKREDILRNPGYWIAQIQTMLYNCAENYMKENNLNRSQLAKRLGVSKGYVSQLLNGDYDHKLSKLVELSLAFDVVPKVEFESIEDVINDDRMQYHRAKWQPVIYTDTLNFNTVHISDSEEYVKSNPDVA